MNKAIGYVSACCVCCAALFGCAVTTPTEQDTARVRSAVDDDPAVRIEQIALHLGVSELAVVRALPGDMARAWQGTPQQAWEAVQGWPAICMRSANAEYLGKPPFVLIEPPGQARVVKDRLRVELDWAEVQAVWLIRKPAGDGELEALWWFDGSGDAVLQVRVPGTADEASASRAGFARMWGAAARPIQSK